jgi:hypothetical protein
MNKGEKFFYDLVKSKPWIKNIFRNLYQSFYDFLPLKKEFFKGQIDFRMGYFFGFHDINPFSIDNKKVLTNKLLHNKLIIPKVGERLDVGYFKLNGDKFGDFVKIGESTAWNFHKGCRLQWLDPETVIFNTFIKNNLVSKVVNIETNNSKLLNFPIDSISSDGVLASTFSYERLNEFMPGYGYEGAIDGGFLDEKAPFSTGVFIYNIKDQKLLKMINLFELFQLNKNISTVPDFNHYVTHSEFSKDSRYLSFLHRWVGSDVKDRKSKLLIYDLKEDSIIEVNTSGMVSHYVWNNNNEIIAYCSIGNIDGHYIISVSEIVTTTHISPNYLNSDGHQSFISNNKFITDTYPDKYRMSKLKIVNTLNHKFEIIASVYSPKEFQTKNFKNHIACDLHPRVSDDGNLICFDSVRNKTRSLCIMKI